MAIADAIYVRATELHDFGSEHVNYDPECGQHIDACEDDGSHFYNANGVMVIGCEGYWLHDPALFGLDRGQWEDWKD